MNVLHQKYRQLRQKPTGSAGGKTEFDKKVIEVFSKDPVCKPDQTGSSLGGIRGECLCYINLLGQLYMLSEA